MACKLTIVVSSQPIPGTAEFIYHSRFKEDCNISHWNSRGETLVKTVVDRAREVAKEYGYETNQEYEINDPEE